MQSLFDYIISTENRYNNIIDVDGKELVVNTEITERDYIIAFQEKFSDITNRKELCEYNGSH